MKSNVNDVIYSKAYNSILFKNGYKIGYYSYKKIFSISVMGLTDILLKEIQEKSSFNLLESETLAGLVSNIKRMIKQGVNFDSICMEYNKKHLIKHYYNLKNKK